MQISLEALKTGDADATQPRADDRVIAVQMKDFSRDEVRTKPYDKFESHLEYLRATYDRLNDGEFEKATIPTFYEPAGSELIGVATLFLAELGHGMTLELVSTIVGQDGKSHGQLTVMVVVEPKDDAGSLTTKSKITPLEIGHLLRFNISIKVARDIPHQLSTFVNARVSLFGEEEMMIPEILTDQGLGGKDLSIGEGSIGTTVFFDQTRQNGVRVIRVTEQFLSYLKTSMHTIQIWGNNVNVTNEVVPGGRVAGNKSAYTNSPHVSRKAAAMLGIKVTPESERQAAHLKFSERWQNHVHSLDLWCEVLELDDEGQYAPVGVVTNKNVLVGPIQQIRQGFARRLKLSISLKPDDPLAISKVTAVRFGEALLLSYNDVSNIREQTTASFGEDDLDILREEFSNVLNERKTELDNAMRKALQNEDMPEEDRATHIEQWMGLVAERDALLRPEPDSGLPGAPSLVSPAPCYERKAVPVYHPVSGASSVRPLVVERGSESLDLHIISQEVEQWTRKVTCSTSWDATAHDDPNLLKVTDGKNVVYMRLQIDCRLANSGTDIKLNKLIALKVYRRTFNFKDASKGFFSFSSAPVLPRGTGAMYEVVTSLPVIESDEEVPEEIQTESATAQLQKNIESRISLVQIDQLKQMLAFKNAGVTPPNQIRDVASRPRSSSMMMRRGHSAPQYLGRVMTGQFSSQSTVADMERQIQEAEASQNFPRVTRLKSQPRSSEPRSNDGWVMIGDDGSIDRGAGTGATSAPTVMAESSPPKLHAGGATGASPAQASQTTAGLEKPSPQSVRPHLSEGLVRRLVPVSPPREPASPDEVQVAADRLPVDPSLMGFLRGKLSSAKSSSELKAAGQLIQNLKEEAKLPSSELSSLRTLYRAQAASINAVRAAAKAPPKQTESTKKAHELQKQMLSVPIPNAESPQGSVHSGYPSSLDKMMQITPAVCDGDDDAKVLTMSLDANNREPGLKPIVPSVPKPALAPDKEPVIVTLPQQLASRLNGKSLKPRTRMLPTIPAPATKVLVSATANTGPATVVSAWANTCQSFGVFDPPATGDELVGGRGDTVKERVTPGTRRKLLPKVPTSTKTAVSQGTNYSGGGGETNVPACDDLLNSPDSQMDELLIKNKHAGDESPAILESIMGDVVGNEAEVVAAPLGNGENESPMPPESAANALRAKIVASRERKARRCSPPATSACIGSGGDSMFTESGTCAPDVPAVNPLKAKLQARIQAKKVAELQQTMTAETNTTLKLRALPQICAAEIKAGDRVAALTAHNKKGVAKYVGTVSFESGIWCGVQLDEPTGKNDGKVQGVRYFTCKEKYGMFVRVEDVVKG